MSITKKFTPEFGVKILIINLFLLIVHIGTVLSMRNDIETPKAIIIADKTNPEKNKEVIVETARGTNIELSQLKEQMRAEVQHGVPLEDRKVKVKTTYVKAWVETKIGPGGKETRDYTLISKFNHKSTVDKYMPLPDKVYENVKQWYYDWKNLDGNHVVMIIEKSNKRISTYQILKN